MAGADREQGSARRVVVVAGVVAALGVVGFLVMRSATGVHDGAPQAAAEPAPSSDAPRTASAPKALAAVASRAVADVRPAQAPSGAARPAPSWQATLQPAVVSAVRAESLAAYQVQVDRWTCEGDKCIGDLTVPPTTDAGRTGNMQATADILDKLQKQMAPADIQVALSSVQRGAQGIAIALEFTPNASQPGRFYTNAEIASIRLEMFEQGQKVGREQQAAAH